MGLWHYWRAQWSSKPLLFKVQVSKWTLKWTFMLPGALTSVNSAIRPSLFLHQLSSPDNAAYDCYWGESDIFILWNRIIYIFPNNFESFYLVTQTIRNLPVMPETRAWSLDQSGRSPGEGNGNPLQYSCLENSMDRGAWRASVHGIVKASDTTELLTLSFSLYTFKISILRMFIN